MRPSLFGRLRGTLGFAAFLGAIAVILIVLMFSPDLFSRSNVPDAPTPEPTLRPEELAGATGTVEVVLLIPLPGDPSAFLLSVDDPPNGVSGPGPIQRASGLPLGPHVAAMAARPGAASPATVVLDSVACQSDKKVPVAVEPAAAVKVQLTKPGEKITCVFQTSIISSIRSGTPTPGPR